MNAMWTIVFALVIPLLTFVCSGLVSAFMVDFPKHGFRSKEEWLSILRIKKDKLELEIDQFVIDLKSRPADFELDDLGFKLLDNKNRRTYWVANNHYGFSIIKPGTIHDRESYWGRNGVGFFRTRLGKKAYAAFEDWHKNYSKYVEEAERKNTIADNRRYFGNLEEIQGMTDVR